MSIPSDLCSSTVKHAWACTAHSSVTQQKRARLYGFALSNITCFVPFSFKDGS